MHRRILKPKKYKNSFVIELTVSPLINESRIVLQVSFSDIINKYNITKIPLIRLS